MSKTCPSADRLNRFACGELSNQESLDIENHMSDCRECSHAVEQLESRFAESVRNLLTDPPEDSVLDEPGCETAVRQAKECHSSPTGTPPREHPAEPIRLEQINDYELIGQIGRGGMGTVLKAVHTRLKREVAIKVLDADRCSIPRAVARFKREWEAVGRLDHPNIVRAYDAGEVDGFQFLVMQWIDGWDVSQLAAVTAPLRTEDACEIIRQAALGLEHAHANGLVHRDVKPSNLLLDRAGIVRVSDFGLALLEQGSDDQADDLTLSGQVMGTIDYMAPEQFADTHEVDARADVYSLGATLFRLIIGHPPLHRPNLNTPLKKIAVLANEAAPAVRSLRPEIPADLAELIDSMLARDPAIRPTSTREVVSRLTPFVAAEGLEELLQRLPPIPVIPLTHPASKTATRREDPTAAKPNQSQPQQKTSQGEKEGVQPDPPDVAKLHPLSTQSASHRVRTLLRPAYWVAGLTLVGAFWLASGMLFDRPESDDGRDKPTELKIAQAVLKMGGSLDLLYNDDTLEVTSSDGLPSGPFWIEEIRLVGNNQVDDAFLKSWAGMPRLKAVYLQDTKVGDQGIAALSEISTLHDLYLYGTNLSDSGLRVLVDRLQFVELILSRTKVGDATVNRLANQRRLERLGLKGTSITDSSLTVIGQIKSLRYLDLRDNDIGDESIGGLRSLDQLRELELNGTRLGDKGLEQLEALTSLRKLLVAETAVTEAGIRRFESAVPGCEVIRED